MKVVEWFAAQVVQKNDFQPKQTIQIHHKLNAKKYIAIALVCFVLPPSVIETCLYMFWGSFVIQNYVSTDSAFLHWKLFKFNKRLSGQKRLNAGKCQSVKQANKIKVCIKSTWKSK